MMVAAGTPDLIINTDVREVLVDLFSTADAGRLAAAAAKVDDCERALAYNVSPETCLDALLFEMKKVLDGSGHSDKPCL